jgi:hypothetical protein
MAELAAMWAATHASPDNIYVDKGVLAEARRLLVQRAAELRATRTQDRWRPWRRRARSSAYRRADRSTPKRAGAKQFTFNAANMTKQELIEKAAHRGLPADLTKKIGGHARRRGSPSSVTTSCAPRSRAAPSPRFTYPGFGTFTKKQERAHRTQPADGRAPIVIPPSITVSFVPGQELKALNRAPLKSQG